MSIRIELASDLPPVDSVLGASLAEGFHFVEQLRDEWASGANRFDRPGEAFFAAHDGTMLVGVCGLNVDPYLDDSSVGRLRNLYVLPAYRRQGVGKALLESALGEARKTFLTLRLRAPASPQRAAADSFYLAMGFVPVQSATATHELRLE